MRRAHGCTDAMYGSAWQGPVAAEEVHNDDDSAVADEEAQGREAELQVQDASIYIKNTYIYIYVTVSIYIYIYIYIAIYYMLLCNI